MSNKNVDFIDTSVDTNSEELKHWGIKGMKWGHRRFQNKDGSLTPAGEKRYDDSQEDSGSIKAIKDYKKKEAEKKAIEEAKKAKEDAKKAKDERWDKLSEEEKNARRNQVRQDGRKTSKDVGDLIDKLNKKKEAEKEAKEKAEKEKAEKEAKEKAEKEAKEKAEKEAKEKAEKEAAAKKQAEEETKERAEEERLAKIKKEHDKMKIEDDYNNRVKAREDAIKAEKQAKIDAEVNKLKTASKVASAVGEGAKGVNSLNTAIAAKKNRKQQREEMDAMDNKQLREKVERLELENRYTNATNGRMTKGHTFVRDFCDTAAPVASIAATGLTIAALVKQIKN